MEGCFGSLPLGRNQKQAFNYPQMMSQWQPMNTATSMDCGKQKSGNFYKIIFIFGYGIFSGLPFDTQTGQSASPIANNQYFNT